MRLSLLLFVLAATILDLSAAVGRDLTGAETTEARKVYVAKCAKCHRFYDPKQYGEAEWQKWLNAMSVKSKLKPAQSNALSRYLGDYRNDKLPGKPQDRVR